VQDFHNLKVWEKAHRLNLRVADAIDRFPETERFALIIQMRKSAGSIPTNIAEGCGRGTDADFSRFLQYAMGSACELEYQLIFARDRNYLTTTAHEELERDLLEVKRMLAALMGRIRNPDRSVPQSG